MTLLITSSQARALDGLAKRIRPPTKAVGESEWAPWFGRREIHSKVTEY